MSSSIQINPNGTITLEFETPSGTIRTYSTVIKLKSNFQYNKVKYNLFNFINENQGTCVKSYCDRWANATFRNNEGLCTTISLNEILTPIEDYEMTSSIDELRKTIKQLNGRMEELRRINQHLEEE